MGTIRLIGIIIGMFIGTLYYAKNEKDKNDLRKYYQQKEN